ncbi:SMP-30/gluconolactonase/LRE family protein [Deinococcus soli (ex Cha et al. 2016)]|uniref:Gluconolactonase n=1 Tax=Deinococcus soli (ex Cha et al. 2016) TaxID=1309411 RepID=A0A0F7JRZ1_9DEIO|nr:SMP-30/gluconolactonase/LRE family protein [Deinococcus soli (ex Cha et al. 2016)]AKH17390.1 gluconolactonase [Deinococcus soli (ex Cha et al. 2016)]
MTHPAFQVTHADFPALLPPGAAPEQLGSGYSWTEGPTYVPDRQRVIFSDVRQNRTWAYTDAGQLLEELHPSDYQNGHTVDAQGRLIACSHGARALLRQEPDGTWTTLADRFEGGRLNSPNDVTLHPDGSLWFTDPSYGLDKPEEGGRGEPMEVPGRWVYRLAPDGTLSAPIRDRHKPNGLIFAGADTLLLADTGEHPGTYRYHVTPQGEATLEGLHFTVTPGKTDGLRLDEAGRIWSSAADGVHVLTPDGQELGRILFPQTVSNLCFGGPDGTTLFVTATSGFWRVPTTTRALRL